MFGYILILLFLLPFIDLFLLVELSSIIGFWNTLLIIALTGIIGAGLVKKEGLNIVRKIQRSVTAEEVSRNMLEGILLAVGGLMLLSPGLITDFVGFLSVWRPSRERIIAILSEKFKDSANFRFEVQRI